MEGHVHETRMIMILNFVCQALLGPATLCRGASQRSWGLRLAQLSQRFVGRNGGAAR